MARKFSELRHKMSPERRRRNEAEVNRQLLEMTLQELRQSVGRISQEDIAEMLRVTQGCVSKPERQDESRCADGGNAVPARGPRARPECG